MPASGADPYVPKHGDRRWSAASYVLELDYKVATNHLSGLATIQVEPLEEVTSIEVDLYGLKAAKVLVNGRKPRAVLDRGSRLKVTLPSPTAQPLTLSVTYSGKPRPMPGPDGRAGWEELTDGVLVGSQPHGAPSWFPCNDRPDDKALYRVTLTTDSGYHVAGNGVLIERRNRGGRTSWTYDQGEPMSTYLACVQIGRYAVQQVPAAVPVEVIAPAGTRLQGTPFERQGEMVDAMSSWFGPYPFATYRAVIADDTFEIPLEAQGLASFGRNHLTASWENERLVAHELAHSWFGNSLTASTWSDIWLHEGFACYSEWLWSEESGHLSADEQAELHWDALADKPQDLLLGDPGVDLMFDDRVYKRGALTLHVLRRYLGDDLFFDALRGWTAAHEHGLVTTDELTAHLAKAAGRRAAKVRSLIAEWVFESDLPAM